MKPEKLMEIILSMPGTETAPHFDKTAFKVKGKRIFATLHEPSGMLNVKFSKTDQTVFCAFNFNAIYPVPNKWGLQGWTTIELEKAPNELIKEALETAYTEVFRSKKK